MPGLKDFLRRQLSQRGYVVTKVEPEIPPALGGVLRTIRDRAAAPLTVVCCDSEVRLQSAVLAVFPTGAAVFASPILEREGSRPVAGTVLPPIPSGPFVAIIDLATYPLAPLLALLPWLSRARTLLLRARFGSFWCGDLDLARLQGEVVAGGFHIADMIDGQCGLSQYAQSERPTLVCERGPDQGLPASQRYRVNEALAELSAPIARRDDSRLLAGCASFGFPAGVLNPGALAEGGGTRLVCRTERFPWAEMKTDETRFFAQSPPLLLDLDGEQRITGSAELSLHGLPDAATSRAEDFRLFRFRGKSYSNHAVISNPPGRPLASTPPRLDLMQTRLGISRFEVAEKRLAWCGLPIIDRPLARTEKNWAIFTDGDRLFLLYSFSPYILLAAKNWPGLEFATVTQARFAAAFAGDGLALRNSINPVDYDERHWLHVVHKVYPNKRYSYWAVLIDKTSLQPARVSVRPVIYGWRSGSAAIIYACSVVVRANDILVFAGVDDCGTTVTKVPRARLDAEWVNVVSTDL